MSQLLASLTGGQLWLWECVLNGQKKTYQSHEKSGIASESEMLALLKRHYPKVTITALRRGHHREQIHTHGPVDRHAFQHGIWDAVRRELGLMPTEKRASILERFGKEESLVRRETFRERFSRDKLMNLAGIRRPSVLNRLQSVR